MDSRVFFMNSVSLFRGHVLPKIVTNDDSEDSGKLLAERVWVTYAHNAQNDKYCRHAKSNQGSHDFDKTKLAETLPECAAAIEHILQLFDSEYPIIVPFQQAVL